MSADDLEDEERTSTDLDDHGLEIRRQAVPQDRLDIDSQSLDMDPGRENFAEIRFG
jgi:hypothetical protein